MMAKAEHDQHAAVDNVSLADRLHRVRKLFKEITALEKTTAEKYWNLGRELIAYKKLWCSDGKGKYGQWEEHIEGVCGLSMWKKAKRIAEWDSPERIRGLTLGEAMRRLPKKQQQSRKTKKVHAENLSTRVRAAGNASTDSGTLLEKLDVGSAATRFILPPTEDEVTVTQDYITTIGGPERAIVLVNHVAGLIKA